MLSRAIRDITPGSLVINTYHRLPCMIFSRCVSTSMREAYEMNITERASAVYNHPGGTRVDEFPSVEHFVKSVVHP